MRAELNWKPDRLDVGAFAREGAELHGRWVASDLPRWLESQWCPVEEAERLPAIDWSLRGERRERLGSPPEVWLHLSVSTGYRLECQRCLQAVERTVSVDRSFRFVRDEASAESEDLDSDEDLLVLSRTFDARELIEDELLLALPLVPLHEACSAPEFASEPEGVSGEEPSQDERPNPFAALAVLKKQD
ncbi:YceD family protein [Inhella gelatinilytica]|uniref:Large ribosomal RNA subunit accumulation protein YceD n=1 Tax=Inhella gelatinilytica TaxID=2795030 RepID=A0A931J0V6_9BURK|nr:YceD family protein [Inhella gelatinilytica]MBH9553306.1 DUF177 domain-containing protein [Inhella gelatinilytica]